MNCFEGAADPGRAGFFFGASAASAGFAATSERSFAGVFCRFAASSAAFCAVAVFAAALCGRRLGALDEDGIAADDVNRSAETSAFAPRGFATVTLYPQFLGGDWLLRKGVTGAADFGRERCVTDGGRGGGGVSNGDDVVAQPAANRPSGYWSPETVNKEPYTFEPDWWSLGVTIFCLNSDRLPFHGKTDEEKDAATCSGVIDYKHGETEGLQSLVSALCTVDMKARLTGLTAFKAHPYFAGFDFYKLEEVRVHTKAAALATSIPPLSAHSPPSISLHAHLLRAPTTPRSSPTRTTSTRRRRTTSRDSRRRRL